MRELLGDLRENLLGAGLAPRHVERYLRELCDHRDDIADHLEAAGMSPETARREAEQRLGNRDSLLLPMLANDRFRSPAARWPALLYFVLPLLLHVAAIVLAILALAIAADTSLRPFMTDLGSLFAFGLLVLPVLIGWGLLIAAQRRRATLHWPLLGALSGIALATALQLGITLPAPEMPGEIGLSLGLPALVPLVTLGALSLLPLALQICPE